MSPDPDNARDLASALGSYRRLMEQEVVPESQYYLLSRREAPERIEYLGNVIERAAARTVSQELLAAGRHPWSLPRPKALLPRQQTRAWAERTNHNARRRCT
ncbi:hypothetical protein GCM10009735_74930 [Actinomadura chokoriensis]